ncbi:Choline transporter-like protein, partial [Globisporangium splendens]
MCTIAGAICRYYWSRNKNATEMGRFPILYSFKNCLRYHFGSLAYGSFIIAVVQFVRAILMYIDHQTQGVQKSNLVVKVAMKAVQCCMWCLEKCLKFLSKNAYIMVAMNGTGFCTSAKDAFKILLSNLAQVGTVSMATFLLLSAGKLAITMACTITMFAYIESKPEEFGIGARHEIASPMAPVLLTMVLAWFVASTFLGVYEMAIDTILLCFCQDKARNSDTGAYFMSDSLRKFIDSVPVSTSHNNSNGSAPPAAQVHAGG